MTFFDFCSASRLIALMRSWRAYRCDAPDEKAVPRNSRFFPKAYFAAPIQQ
jgi:hypothetical protein